jgi:hypothetical protein
VSGSIDFMLADPCSRSYVAVITSATASPVAPRAGFQRAVIGPDTYSKARISSAGEPQSDE